MAGTTSTPLTIAKRVEMIAPIEAERSRPPGERMITASISADSTKPAKIVVRPAVFAASVAACLVG